MKYAKNCPCASVCRASEISLILPGHYWKIVVSKLFFKFFFKTTFQFVLCSGFNGTLFLKLLAIKLFTKWLCLLLTIFRYKQKCSGLRHESDALLLCMIRNHSGEACYEKKNNMLTCFGCNDCLLLSFGSFLFLYIFRFSMKQEFCKK